MASQNGETGLSAREQWEQGRRKEKKVDWTWGGCICAVLRFLPDGLCKCTPQPKVLKRNNMWCLYRGFCNYLVALAFLSGTAYCSVVLLRQSAQEIKTPKITIVNMMPLSTPTLKNWELKILLRMRFINEGDRNFTMSSFVGGFEYKDLTDLGLFELQPESLPFTMRPKETKYILAKLTMYNHDLATKARLSGSLIAEWLGQQNPVLKLRSQTSGVVWAWDRMVKFNAEYLSQYTLYVAEHGLGLVDFSDWDLAQKRWQDALNQGRAQADEGISAFERTKVDGEIMEPLRAFLGVALACMFCSCLICCFATCYPCYFPDEHGSTPEWASLAWVICFGRRIPARQPESQPLQNSSEARDDTSFKQPAPGMGAGPGMVAAAYSPAHGKDAAPGMHAAPGRDQTTITASWMAGATVPVYSVGQAGMAAPHVDSTAYSLTPAPGMGPAGMMVPVMASAGRYMSPAPGMGSAGMISPGMNMQDSAMGPAAIGISVVGTATYGMSSGAGMMVPAWGAADGGMLPVSGMDFSGKPHGRWSAVTRIDSGKGQIHTKIGRPDAARE
eukprot:TRINITY_DN64615_c0_g1_i1.p1 TRINITY_DN64615_c0_g1~~TRINITY_DN64615_c0_g1_i1.p1  ORF type:complete len:557 (+),score=78.99 TRINITY_DN64615_c0_g1_i1:57-1727(+)